MLTPLKEPVSRDFILRIIIFYVYNFTVTFLRNCFFVV